MLTPQGVKSWSVAWESHKSGFSSAAIPQIAGPMTRSPSTPVFFCSGRQWHVVCVCSPSESTELTSTLHGKPLCVNSSPSQERLLMTTHSCYVDFYSFGSIELFGVILVPELAKMDKCMTSECLKYPQPKEERKTESAW